MLEDIYNFRRSKLLGLRTEAIMAMRSRNPTHKGKAEEAEEAASA